MNYTKVQETVGNTLGELRAWVYFEITGINGVKSRRRVSLGTDYSTTLDSARDTLAQTRKSNSLPVLAEFRINL